MHKAPNEKSNMLWKKPEIVHALMVAAKKTTTKKRHFVLASCSQHISQAVFLVWSPKTVVWSVRNFEWLINMGKEMSFLIAQGSNSIEQFCTEWTQKLRACLLRWEGPDVGVWHLSFLRTYSLFWPEGTLFLNPRKNATKIPLFLWIT